MTPYPPPIPYPEPIAHTTGSGVSSVDLVSFVAQSPDISLLVMLFVLFLVLLTAAVLLSLRRN